MFVLRHGKSLHNTVDLKTGEKTGDAFWQYGNDDILGLTPDGIEGLLPAIRDLGARIRHHRPLQTRIKIYSSPAIRALQTSSLIITELYRNFGLEAVSTISTESTHAVCKYPLHGVHVMNALRELPTPTIQYGELIDFPKFKDDRNGRMGKHRSFMEHMFRTLHRAGTQILVNEFLDMHQPYPNSPVPIVIGHHYSLAAMLGAFLLRVQATATAAHFWQKTPRTGLRSVFTDSTLKRMGSDPTLPAWDNCIHEVSEVMHKMYIEQNKVYDLVGLSQWVFSTDRQAVLHNDRDVDGFLSRIDTEFAKANLFLDHSNT